MIWTDFEDVLWGMTLVPPQVSLKGSSWKNPVGGSSGFVVGDDLGTTVGFFEKGSCGRVFRFRCRG